MVGGCRERHSAKHRHDVRAAPRAPRRDVRQRHAVHVRASRRTRSARTSALTNVSGDAAGDSAARSSRARGIFSGRIAAPGRAGFCPTGYDPPGDVVARSRRICALVEGDRRLVRRAAGSTPARPATRQTTTRFSSAPTTSGTMRNIGRNGRSRRTGIADLTVLAGGQTQTQLRGRSYLAAVARVLRRRRRRQFWNVSLFHIYRRHGDGRSAYCAAARSSRRRPVTPELRTSRPTRARVGWEREPPILLGRARRREPVGIVERRLPARRRISRMSFGPSWSRSHGTPAIRANRSPSRRRQRSTDRGTSCPISTSVRSASTRE